MSNYDYWEASKLNWPWLTRNYSEYKNTRFETLCVTYILGGKKLHPRIFFFLTIKRWVVLFLCFYVSQCWILNFLEVVVRRIKLTMNLRNEAWSWMQFLEPKAIRENGLKYTKNWISIHRNAQFDSMLDTNVFTTKSDIVETIYSSQNSYYSVLNS